LAVALPEVAARVAEARIEIARRRVPRRVRAVGNALLRLLQERAVLPGGFLCGVAREQIKDAYGTYSLWRLKFCERRLHALGPCDQISKERVELARRPPLRVREGALRGWKRGDGAESRGVGH
jgi:hypothetical protein